MIVVPFLVCNGRETHCQVDTYPCDGEWSSHPWLHERSSWHRLSVRILSRSCPSRPCGDPQCSSSGWWTRQVSWPRISTEQFSYLWVLIQAVELLDDALPRADAQAESQAYQQKQAHFATLLRGPGRETLQWYLLQERSRDWLCRGRGLSVRVRLIQTLTGCEWYEVWTSLCWGRQLATDWHSFLIIDLPASPGSTFPLCWPHLQIPIISSSMTEKRPDEWYISSCSRNKWRDLSSSSLVQMDF